MTHFLISEENPDGLKLEDILAAIRKDILLRCTKIVDDKKIEATQVLDNSLKILNLLTEAIHLAENSTQVLDKSFEITFEACDCVGVRAIPSGKLAETDFYLEMPFETWQGMLENIKERGGTPEQTARRATRNASTREVGSARPRSRGGRQRDHAGLLHRRRECRHERHEVHH